MKIYYEPKLVQSEQQIVYVSFFCKYKNIIDGELKMAPLEQIKLIEPKF